jgi:putative transposase
MILTNYKNHLPHIQPIGATFFVTFSLADSIPIPVLDKLKKEHEFNIAQIKFSDKSTIEKEELLNREQKLHFKRYDDLLDDILNGAKHLSNPDIAQLVFDKIKSYHNQFYYLYAFCIMPNHVHALMDFSIQVGSDFNYNTSDYTQLFEVLKNIKGNTGYYANKILSNTGSPFWQKDSYDHYVRNQKELANIFNYIINNPVKAHLVEKSEDWQWTYVSPDLL